MSVETAKKIRESLKAAGYGPKRVAVRNHSYSMGSSVNVTVKDATANLKEIEAIAHENENVRRCEYSGEILSGGNTFVFVAWSREAEQAMAEPFLAAAEAAFEKAGDTVHANVQGTGLTITKSHHDVTVWGESRERLTYCDGKDFSHLATAIAQVIKRAA